MGPKQRILQASHCDELMFTLPHCPGLVAAIGSLCAFSQGDVSAEVCARGFGSGAVRTRVWALGRWKILHVGLC